MKLEVHSALEDENYLDIVRIPRDFRTTRQGEPIESGSVCRIYCADTGKEAYVVARGLAGEEPRIRIDCHIRQKLGVSHRQTYDYLSQRHSGAALGSTIEVRLRNGRSLMVAPEFNAGHLRALLAVLESES